MFWIYNNTRIKSINDFPEECVGFVYKITNLETNRVYVGKKQLKTKKNVKITKKELSQIVTPGRRPLKKTVISESDWSSYFGSSKVLLKDVKEQGEGCFKREILQLCYNKKQLSYYEHKYQFLLGVLEDPNKFYNENIGGKWFPRDLAS